MGKIIDLKKYIDELQQKGVKIVHCANFIPQDSHGQVCKLVAAASVQKYVYDQKRHSEAPLPVHKNHGLFEHSLRERAKQYGSKVGEVYGPKGIAKVISYNKFATDSYHITDKKAYEQFLIAALNQKQPVMVYFDVIPRSGKNPKSGEPNNYHGTFEHAAVITGYFYSGGKLRLIAAEWEGFYEMSFDQLFESTSQLSQSKHPEHYKKYYPIPSVSNRKIWMETEQMKRALDLLTEHHPLKRSFYHFLNFVWLKQRGERISTPSTTDSTSLANVLTIISGDQNKIDLKNFDKYKVPMNEDDLKNSSTLSSLKL